jgi:predicted small secreted protein
MCLRSHFSDGKSSAPVLPYCHDGHIIWAIRSGDEDPSLEKRITLMNKSLSLALAFLALIGLAPILGACHTTAGVGEDLSAGGHAITNSAEKHTP